VVYVTRALMRSEALVILGCFDVLGLLVGYATLRACHVSVRWATWGVGLFIGGISVLACVGLLLHAQTGAVADVGLSNLLGYVSFLVAIYAATLWLTRHWYLLIKRQTLRWLARQSRHMLRYLRDHHRFFGWLVLLTATAHTVLLLPIVAHLSSYEVITGIVALALLAALTALGEWIEYRVRHKRLAPHARLWHSLLTIVFLVAFAFHA